MTNKTFKLCIILPVAVILVILYAIYNPSESQYFPKCPFFALTGCKCPGCGSQRAIHYLLNFNIFNAIKENVLLVVAIPYLLFSISVDTTNKLTGKLSECRKILSGKKSIYIILFIIITFWIARNLIHC
ncbi:MAG: DUF2752 domain-containing protein [Prevotellaceae bacterium]|nr:DUF2752 domain-containing protein [Prevotellaceae bacterium]